MNVVYYPYRHPGERPGGDKPVWDWHEILKDEARKAVADPSDEFNLGSWAPMSAFHAPPMIGALVQLVKGTLVEVELPAGDKMRTDTLNKAITPFWIAECIHMVGYYILARWCGARKKGEGYLWMHSANAAVHQVGYAEDNRENGCALIPPHALFYNETESGWKAILHEWSVGDRVETIHGEESSVLYPAIVNKVLGRRVLLKYSRSDMEKADLVKKANMWRDMNDDLIYPVGFAQTMGLQIKATKKYKSHVAAQIAKSMDNEEGLPYHRADAKKKETIYKSGERKQVVQYTHYIKYQTSPWQVDMVCEMLDRLDQCQNVLKAARVLQVLPDGYLQIGPEGPDILNDSFYIHQTTTNLFPVGYAKSHNIALQGPKGDEDEPFEWDSFLERTKYTPAPPHFFDQATSSDVSFKVGMRLEAIDQNEKAILWPAKVKKVKGRLLLVSFDGWAEKFDQLFDFRSNELLPCGWAEMVEHALQAPPAKRGMAKLQDEEATDDEAMEE